jgi:hypothetical protein
MPAKASRAIGSELALAIAFAKSMSPSGPAPDKTTPRQTFRVERAFCATKIAVPYTSSLVVFGPKCTMISDIKNLAPTIMLWSGVIMLLSAPVLAFYYYLVRTLPEEFRTIGFLIFFGMSAVMKLLFAVALAAFLIAAVAFGVGLTGYVVIVTLFFIQTGSPFVSILFVAVAILLYGMRTRYPFVYGFIEVVVGVSAIIWVLPNQPTESSIGLFSELLSVSGGVYVIVRGLDNASKATPGDLRLLWVILRWGVPLDKK